MPRTESRATDMFGYLLHQKKKLLARLQTELKELVLDSGIDSEQTAIQLEQKIRVASEAIDSLKYQLARATRTSELAKMRALKLTREKEMLAEVLKGMKSTAFLIEKAEVVQSTKLGLVSLGVKQDQHSNLLQISSRFNKAKEMAEHVSDFLTQQAQEELTKSNFEERVKQWRERIHKYSALHTHLVPMCARYRCTVYSLEVNTMKAQVQRMFQALQEKTLSASIEKYCVTLHSNQRLSANINHLLIQQSQTRSRKRSLKMQLIKLRDEIHGNMSLLKSPRNFCASPTNKEIIALQQLTVDALSMCNRILGKIDRTDPKKLLGPHIEDLMLTEPSVTEHCVSVLLIIEKKVKTIEVVLKQRTEWMSGPRFVQSEGFWEKPPVKTVNLKHTTKSVNDIKRNIYLSHFLEDANISQVDSMLNGVAHVQFQMSRGIKHLQSTKVHNSSTPVLNDTEKEEITHLKLEQKLKKKRMKEPGSSSPFRRNQRCDSYRKFTVMDKSAHHKSNLELLTGIPNITQCIHELNKSVYLFQQSGEQSLKEVYEELVSKKCETDRVHLRKIKKECAMKRNGSGDSRFPLIRNNSGSPRSRVKSDNFLIAPMTETVRNVR